MKTGLVLEGGGMRGLFTAGVIDVLMENGIQFDGAVGVSAGAAFGCNYKTRQIGRAIRYNKRFANDRRYASWWSLFTTGNYFNADFAYHYLPNKLDVVDFDTFRNNPMEFWAVATNVGSGKAVYRQLKILDYEELEFVRASASMPLMSKIVKLKGQRLLDGGVADSIPLDFFQRQGYKRNVVVLTQPMGHQKRPNKLMPLLQFQNAESVGRTPHYVQPTVGTCTARRALRQRLCHSPTGCTHHRRHLARPRKDAGNLRTRTQSGNGRTAKTEAILGKPTKTKHCNY